MTTTDDINDRIADALAALLDWGRENTSPRDPNSPHDLLVKAADALAARKALLQPAPAELSKVDALHEFKLYMADLRDNARADGYKVDAQTEWRMMVGTWRDNGQISEKTEIKWLATGPR